MLVTHYYHSGCLVELDHHQLLFDYYQGELKINKDKPLYIFVSHRHFDHYNPDIFKIDHPNKVYILSTTLRHKYEANYVENNQEYTFHDVVVKTLLSTDEGCAFIVEVEGKTIYHCGDLNWWHWDGEGTKSNDYQRITYQQQINLINQPIDIAFVVVDKRQEEHYLLGLQYFMNHVQTKYIFPIHFFGDYTISEQLKEEKLENPFQATIIDIHHQNELFQL
ncbi:MAG: MBL fold metallo-hydrolase [Coprobacillus sp.]